MKPHPFNIVTTALAVALLAYAFTGKARAAELPTSTANPATLAPRLRGLVLDTPLVQRLQAPPSSGLFARLKFQARHSVPCLMVLGVGAHTRKDCGMAEPMCLSPLPPVGLDSLRVVPKSRSGATMHPAIQGTTMPALATSATTPQAHQLFADACNCAAMASWYTKRGNIAAATRKARQHMAALRLLAKLEGGAA